jgi:cysteine desulfurase
MIYLDYQATTPLAPEALEAMLPWLRDQHANPHSAHAPGRRAKAAVEVARAQVIETLLGEDRSPGSLVFTSGATEALNWAIKGTFANAAPRGRRKVVTIATEHAAVLDTVKALEAQGAEAVILPVGGDGHIDFRNADAVDERTALVAAMYVNNEIGTTQHVGLHALSDRARIAGVPVICDAVQAYGKLRVPVGFCDMIAISAHKAYGPKGIGALWVRDGFAPAPLMHGGGQEQGLRSGTLSPALCAGFGAAARVAKERADDDWKHVTELYARARAFFTAAGWHVNGSRAAHYPGNLNVRREGLDVARLMSDLRDIAFSAGSACASGSGRPSHVLRAIGLSDAEARSSIRIGFGRYTTEEELMTALGRIDATARAQRVAA